MILTDEEREALFNDSDLECYSSGDIEAACKFAAAIEREVLRKLRERPADAWLVTGSRVYQDSAHIKEEHAQRRIVDRNGISGRSDGSRLVPLHIIPEEHE